MPGEYSRKQLIGGGIMAWSHRRRFATALQLAQAHGARTVLDFGCGDGTLVGMLAATFPRAVGAEIDPRLVQHCAERFRHLPNASFVLTEELAASAPHSFGLIMCTEVLEHCTSERLDAAIDTMRHLLARDGTLVVSVPVETGPALAVKQVARAVKALIGGEATYRDRERYTLSEFLVMLLAGEKTAIPRPVYRQDFAPDRPNPYHGHKGFNWRALRSRLALSFVIHRTTFSPTSMLGPGAASQAWLICGPR